MERRQFGVSASRPGWLCWRCSPWSARAPRGQTVRAGNLIVTVEGGFTPHKLPKKEPAAITLSARSTIRTADGTHLPALDFLKLEFDKHTGVYTKGLPVCTTARLSNTLTTQAKRVLPRRDHRQRPGRRRNRLPRTGAVLRQGADGDLQRPAQRTATRSSSSTSTPTCRRRRPSSPPRRSARPPASTGPASKSRSRRSSPARARSASPNSRSTKNGWSKGKEQTLLYGTCPSGHFFVRGALTFKDGFKMAGKVVRSCTPTK